MEVTLGSPVMRVNACLIASAVAPPPTSTEGQSIQMDDDDDDDADEDVVVPRKLAGWPPLSLMISMVAIANPAPFTGRKGQPADKPEA